MDKKKFRGIDEIFREETEKPAGGIVQETAMDEVAKTTVVLPRALHRQVKKYAIDAGMKEKQVIATAVQEFIERHYRNN